MWPVIAKVRIPFPVKPDFLQVLFQPLWLFILRRRSVSIIINNPSYNFTLPHGCVIMRWGVVGSSCESTSRNNLAYLQFCIALFLWARNFTPYNCLPVLMKQQWPGKVRLGQSWFRARPSTFHFFYGRLTRIFLTIFAYLWASVTLSISSNTSSSTVG